MARTTDEIEAKLLGAVRVDNTIIDRALQSGLSPEHFYLPAHREQWRLAVAMRTEGTQVSDESLYAKAHAMGLLEKMGGMERFLKTGTGSALGAEEMIVALVTTHAKRESYRRLKKAVDGLKAESMEIGDLRELVEQVGGICSGQRSTQRSLADIDAEIEVDVQNAREGKTDDSKLITWGLPKLDMWLRPIKAHEYVLICARPSRGKSSMLTAIAGANLAKGKRVAFFTLETSDKAVMQQMAAQQAVVPLEQMREWMGEHYARFNRARLSIRDSKRLLIFDKDMTLDAIQARCRLLATSFKPDVVIIDYLGLVQTPGKSPYERVSLASKSMIPLRKALGCPLIVGQQLNRAAEAQEREPNTADLRDSGQLEEDAHRVVMLHWTDSSKLDQEVRPYKILQPKLRDGRTTAVVGIEFHAPTTTWREA